MEQDENVYLYRMGDEVYRFEAHSDLEAEKVRPYALLHFRDKLGEAFAETRLQGPQRIVLKAHHGFPVMKSVDLSGRLGTLRVEAQDVSTNGLH